MTAALTVLIILAVSLKRLGWFEDCQPLIITQMPDGTQIKEHVTGAQCIVDAANLGLLVLQWNDDSPVSGPLHLTKGDRILRFGPPKVCLALNSVTAPQ